LKSTEYSLLVRLTFKLSNPLSSAAFTHVRIIDAAILYFWLNPCMSLFRKDNQKQFVLLVQMNIWS
ncbi:hypothetical protein LOB58_10670, partial [Lactobacillus delbrueckii subsp. lactis]|uniref:hypothetical protein n=1 Tax=Lactobacillus delbrueckii TaxID=1584 RepID=UPI001E49021F